MVKERTSSSSVASDLAAILSTMRIFIKAAGKDS